MKKVSPIRHLDPLMYHDDILCVGSRIGHADLPFQKKTPADTSKERARYRAGDAHHHTKSHHQGRSITHASI